MTAEQPDAGMHAVARVRGVREQDSRLGLRRAAADQREAERRVGHITEELGRVGAADGAVGDFLTARATGLALAGDASAAREAAATAVTVTTSARDHWQRAHSGLAAIELLLERRQEARAAERDRREAAELDDLALARWLRARRDEVRP